MKAALHNWVRAAPLETVAGSDPSCHFLAVQSQVIQSICASDADL